MEGSTDRGLFGFGHKHEEKPTQHAQGDYGSAQQQPFKTEQGSGYGTGTTGTNPATETYSAAPGVPPESTQSHGESKKPGFMAKVEHTLGVDKLKEKKGEKKAGHKKSGSSSSSSSDEEDGGKKKHSIL